MTKVQNQFKWKIDWTPQRMRVTRTLRIMLVKMARFASEVEKAD